MSEDDPSLRRQTQNAGVFTDEVLMRMVAQGRASGAPVDGETALMRLRTKYQTMIDGERR